MGKVDKMNIHERIDHMIKALCNDNASEFAAKVGEIPSKIGHYAGRGNRVSMPKAAFLEKVSNAFPSVSYSWLLKGEGDMLKQGGEEETLPVTVEDVLRDQVNYLKDQSQVLQNEKAQLIAQLNNLSVALRAISESSLGKRKGVSVLPVGCSKLLTSSLTSGLLYSSK
ncbi:MAG: hypothetical protein AAF740_08955 [Bacteroidota bacterium]